MKIEVCLKSLAWLAVFGVLLVLSAPAFAGEATEEAPVAVANDDGAPANPCSQDLSPEETFLPLSFLDLPTEVAGGPPRLRTCACSCGFPCSTNEDCGFGGVCISGITCCRAPAASEEAEPLTADDTTAS